jgi:hypothetical protein
MNHRSPKKSLRGKPPVFLKKSGSELPGGSLQIFSGLAGFQKKTAINII